MPRSAQALDRPHRKTALVVGTAMTQTGRCTKEEVSAVAGRIASAYASL
mgnify:CR=1 FL=1